MGGHLEIPAGWYLHGPVADPTDIAAEVDRQVAERPELGPHRTAMLSTLTGLHHHARQAGALVAATLFEPGVMGSSVAHLVLVDATRRFPGSPEAELAHLETELARPAPGDIGPRDVRRVDLPCGPAVRLAVLTRTVEEPGRPVALLDGVQFWIPVDAGGLALLSGSTPCLDRGAELSTLWDHIAATLAFV